MHIPLRLGISRYLVQIIRNKKFKESERPFKINVQAKTLSILIYFAPLSAPFDVDGGGGGAEAAAAAGLLSSKSKHG